MSDIERDTRCKKAGESEPERPVPNPVGTMKLQSDKGSKEKNK
jgi:hypothetical protein